MKYWWMSFADPDRPQGDTFLGVAICRGDNLGEAIARAWEKGCNPGGEVAALEVPFLTDPSFTGVQPDRLLSQKELERLGVKQSQQSIG